MIPGSGFYIDINDSLFLLQVGYQLTTKSPERMDT